MHDMIQLHQYFTKGLDVKLKYETSKVEVSIWYNYTSKY